MTALLAGPAPAPDRPPLPEHVECAVVGGGVGGLCIASLLNLYGVRTAVFERQDYVGGMITDYRVHGYRLAHSVDWLSGLHAGGKARAWLERTGAAERVEFRALRSFKRVLYGRHDVLFPCDYDRFRAELLRHFPGQRAGIDHLLAMVRSFGGPDWISHFRPFKDATFGTLLDRLFTDGDLKKILHSNLNADMSAYMYVLYLFRALNGEIFLPVGSLKDFFETLAAGFEADGVAIHRRAPVSAILVADGRAVGVRLADGREIRADVVVTDIDLRTVYDELLPAGCVNDYFLGKLRERPVSASLVCVEVGVGRDLSGASPDGAPVIHIDDFARRHNVHNEFDLKITVRSVNEPDAAPRGRSVVDIRSFCPPGLFGSYPADGRYHDDAYARTKAECERHFLERSYAVLGDYSADIEVVRTATPHTFRRYVGGQNGSPMGWSVEPSAYVNGFRITSPLARLFHVGCWASFPGFEGVVNYCFSLLPRILRTAHPKTLDASSGPRIDTTEGSRT